MVPYFTGQSIRTARRLMAFENDSRESCAHTQELKEDEDIYYAKNAPSWPVLFWQWVVKNLR